MEEIDNGNVFYIREEMRHERDRSIMLNKFDSELEEHRKEYEKNVMAEVLCHIHRAFKSLNDLSKCDDTLKMKEFLLEVFDMGDVYMVKKES